MLSVFSHKIVGVVIVVGFQLVTSTSHEEVTKMCTIYLVLLIVAYFCLAYTRADRISSI